MMFRILLITTICAIATSTANLEKKLIACDVCKLLVHTLYTLPGVKDEDGLLEMTNQLCDTSTEQGAIWSRVDIQYNTNSNTLSVVDHSPDIQMCSNECHQTSKACDKIVSEYEDDIAEAMYNGVKEEDLVQKLCYTWTKSCAEVKVPSDFVLSSRDQEFNPFGPMGLSKLKQWKNFKKMQAKTDMGLGTQIDTLEKELNSGVGASFQSSMTTEEIEKMKVKEEKIEETNDDVEIEKKKKKKKRKKERGSRKKERGSRKKRKKSCRV